jgi:uncharacterized repeat protein (TIGR01451 family)
MLHQLQRILLLFVLFWVASFSHAASPPDVALVDVVRSPDPVSVGADLTYKVIVVNNGETVAAGVQITNRLDASVVIKSINASLGTTAISGHEVINSIPSLDPHAEATIEITVVPSKTTTLIFFALVLFSDPDPNMSNNSFTIMTDAIGVPNLPPVTTIDLPADDIQMDALTDLDVSASVTDPDGTVSRVEFFLQDVKLAEKTCPPFTLKVPALRPGSYRLTVRSTDNLEAISVAQRTITTREIVTNKFLFPEYQSDAFQFAFSAHYFTDFVIEAGNPGNWSEIARLTRTNFSGVVIDSGAASAKNRFYRAVQVSP